MYHGCGTELCALDCVRDLLITTTTANRNKNNLATTTTVATEGHREKAEEAATRGRYEDVPTKTITTGEFVRIRLGFYCGCFGYYFCVVFFEGEVRG